MRTSAQYEGVVSDYSRQSAFNTGYARPGKRIEKDKVWNDTKDFIILCKEQRNRINHAIQKGARILPCLR